jgi:transmembrane sensor
MTDIVPFPNDNTIREEAGVWVARVNRGLRDPEQAELQRWINQSPRHLEALTELAALWDRMDVLKELSEMFPLESRRPSSLRRFKPVQLGIGCLVAFAAAYLTLAFLGGHLGSRQTLDETYTTAIGQQLPLTLPDNTVMTLNTDSRVAVHYTLTDRSIDLQQGEAHFKVAKDVRRVFTVRVGQNEFKAVGTAFNLRKTSERGVELTVVEGRVKVVTPPDPNRDYSVSSTAIRQAIAPIYVDAGKELTIGGADPSGSSVQPARVETAVAWTRGMIVFDGQPLERAIREVSRYSTTKFVIADEGIKQIPVVGYFRVGDLDGLLTALQTNFNIYITRTGDTVVLQAHH